MSVIGCVNSSPAGFTQPLTELKELRTKHILYTQGYSRSRTTSVLDFSTNYCNLFNLMDGSGLTQDPALTGDTNDDICVQWSTADCDIY